MAVLHIGALSYISSQLVALLYGSADAYSMEAREGRRRANL